jgi:hypothetical protein
MMVCVVVLTTILTPLALRGAFQLKNPEDDKDISGGTENFLQAPSQSRPKEIDNEESVQLMSTVHHNSEPHAPSIFSKSAPSSLPTQ